MHCFFLILLGSLFCGARINVTSSFPPGVYWVTNKAPEKGDLVLFCPPKREVFDLAVSRGYIGSGSCPGGYMRMIKRISAVAGDNVVFRKDGIFINGKPQANSQWQARDLANRKMPRPGVVEIRLGANDILMLSDYSPISFDGRYFGPVPNTQVQEVIEPWLVWARNQAEVR